LQEPPKVFSLEADNRIGFEKQALKRISQQFSVTTQKQPLEIAII